jgi:nicotinamide phosphoribosyltransferase
MMSYLTRVHSPINAIDAYKLDHRRQYPEGTTRVYSNFTPRGSRIDGIEKVVFFGLQAFLQDYCMDQFDAWFSMPEAQVLDQYKEMTDNVLGPNDVGVEHIRDLWRLGYLPLRFSALPEGTLVPLRVPMFTVENTLPEFAWLVNYIESVLSSQVWLPCTSATTAHHLRKLLDERAAKTGGPAEFVDWQGHDFSFRGMENVQASAASGAGHLLSFTGTDSLPALEYVNYYYYGDNGLVGGSVAATEHSVMCAGGDDGEKATFERLLDLYPSGIVSVVSDTWDLWSVLTGLLPSLKDKILARDGKLVIRPDSGDPVDIICGTLPGGKPTSYKTVDGKWVPTSSNLTPEAKGVAELLWETFGGTINAAGYKELDPHIGMIYGDSINYDRADEMTRRLEEKGFASTNIVLGVGSYTYQYVTRDTFGFAMKATWAEVNGEARNLFKDPVTDNGLKKSAKGRLAVLPGAHGGMRLVSEATPEQEAQSLLKPVWEDGLFVEYYSFAEVRARLRGQ